MSFKKFESRSNHARAGCKNIRAATENIRAATVRERKKDYTRTMAIRLLTRAALKIINFVLPPTNEMDRPYDETPIDIIGLKNERIVDMIPILDTAMENGRIIVPSPILDEIRNTFDRNFSAQEEAYKIGKRIYPVTISDQLKDIQIKYKFGDEK